MDPITEYDERIWRAIDALKMTGSSALQKAPAMRASKTRRVPITTKATAEFLEALAPLVTEMLRDEAQLEEELSTIKSELAGAGSLFRRMRKAKR